MSYVKIGVAGPVGSGKTALIEALTRELCPHYSICVVTNDIYTKEDAEFLVKHSAMDKERILGVETGGCPHTAIREDASMNLEAVEELTKRFPDTQPLGDVQSGTGRRHDLCHRCIRRRQDPAQGRSRHHAVRPARHQQEGPRTVCRGRPRRHGPRFQEDARLAAVPVHESHEERGRA